MGHQNSLEVLRRERLREDILGNNISEGEINRNPHSMMRTCLPQYFESHGILDGNREMQNWLLVDGLDDSYIVPSADATIGYTFNPNLKSGDKILICTAVKGTNRDYSTQCGKSAGTMFSMFSRNTELEYKKSGLGLVGPDRLKEREAKFDDLKRSMFENHNNPLTSTKHKVWVIDVKSYSSDGHSILIERYLKNGRPYYQVYNGWHKRQTLYESLIQPGDSIANEPMDEDQIRRFVTYIQPMNAAQLRSFGESFEKTGKDDHRDVGLRTSDALAASGTGESVLNQLFLNANNLQKYGNADAFYARDLLNRYKRLLLKDDEGMTCEQSWFPTFRKMTTLSQQIITSLNTQC
jgi:hypothetical protein